MSIFNTLNTAISGMAAQANRLGTIGDNIANSSTTGYKRAVMEFETLLGNRAGGNYQSGGVQSLARYGVGDQGTLVGTNSVTDLGINGDGFFLVEGSNGQRLLTRAGSFVPDASGNLVNAAGYKLLGYNLNSDGTKSDQLSVINISSQALNASASSTGSLAANFPSNAKIIAAANLPSANSASATYSAKTSITTYDNLGNAVTLDVYMSKTADNTWEVSVYNKADAAAGGGFPYSSGPMTTQTLNFDGTTGKLTAASVSKLSLAIPNGKTVTLDLSQTTQLASDFAVNSLKMDGSAPSKLDHITIGTDGTVTSVYGNGTTIATNKIPLATVVSPANLIALSGNVYEICAASGPLVVGAAGSGNLGAIDAGSLESSTVDVATELTGMIAAQRGYEANSKVLQTGSDLLSIINNLHF